MTNILNNSSSAGVTSFDRALDQGLSSRLTLIVGPEAHERSQEFNAWLASLGHATLSIHCSSDESGEACPERIVAAFASAGIIEQVTEQIESEEACQAQLVRLMNNLATLADDLVVVLLDYRPCEPADRVLSFILEHLPQQIHLYLICEDVPGLSCIPRLRVRRQLQMIAAGEA